MVVGTDPSLGRSPHKQAAHPGRGFDTQQVGAHEVADPKGRKHAEADQRRIVERQYSFHSVAIGRRDQSPTHSRATRDIEYKTSPMRACSARRSSANSTHPARPAESVSPATPQWRSMPSNRGNGRAKK